MVTGPRQPPDWRLRLPTAAAPVFHLPGLQPDSSSTMEIRPRHLWDNVLRPPPTSHNTNVKTWHRALLLPQSGSSPRPRQHQARLPLQEANKPSWPLRAAAPAALSLLFTSKPCTLSSCLPELSRSNSTPLSVLSQLLVNTFTF